MNISPTPSTPSAIPPSEGTKGWKRGFTAIQTKIKSLANTVKFSASPLSDLFIQEMNRPEEKKKPVWKEWKISFPTGKVDYQQLQAHANQHFGRSFTEQCLLEETERTRKEVHYKGRKNLFTLVEELRKKENFSQRECIDNQTPIRFKGKGLAPEQKGRIQVEHQPNKRGKRDRQTLFYLLSRTFGRELADALFIRYGIRNKTHVTWLDVKNILAGVDANVKFSDLKRLFDHLKREEQFQHLYNKLNANLQQKIKTNSSFTGDEWQEIQNQADSFGWKHLDPAVLLQGLKKEEPLLECRHLLSDESKRTILSKNTFDELSQQECALLLQAFRYVPRNDEEGKPFHASYAQWLFQNEEPNFWGRNDFDTIHHDQVMAQAISRLANTIKDSPSMSHAMAERIARDYIYFEARIGHVLPFVETDGTTSLVTVTDELNASGLHAKVFAQPYPECTKYSDEYPLPIHIAFRGTQMDHYIDGSFESILRDVDSVGIGRRSYHKNRTKLLHMVVDSLLNTSVNAIELCLDGHSLGGVDAERLAVDILAEYNKAFANANYPNREAWLKIKKLRVENFNSPKPNIAVSKKWKQEVKRLIFSNAPLNTSLHFNILRCKNKKSGYTYDMVQNFGDAHIGFNSPTNEKTAREVIIHTLSRPTSLRDLHNVEVYTGKNSSLQSETITDQENNVRIDRILGGNYFDPNVDRTKIEKLIYRLKWIGKAAATPFIFITKLALEIFTRLYISIQRIRFRQKRYYIEPGKAAQLLHRLGLRKKLEERRFHPSYFY